MSQGVEYKDEDTGKDDFYWRYGTFGFSSDVFGKEYENAATASIIMKQIMYVLMVLFMVV